MTQQNWDMQVRESIILDFLQMRVTFPRSLNMVDLCGLGLPVSCLLLFLLKAATLSSCIVLGSDKSRSQRT